MRDGTIGIFLESGDSRILIAIFSKTNLPYEQIKDDLKNLLIEFGPQRQRYHPEHPFVRLYNDGIWDLSSDVDSTNYSDSLLLKNNVIGSFKDEILELLENDLTLMQEVADVILHGHFAESLHEEILNAVGLKFQYIRKKQRDPKFRNKILQAYEYSCAICGFNVRHGQNLVGVEAAHIKWHQAGGPDVEENGLALCTMHHKLFDRGVFTFFRK
nr:HNH endonuclease [Robertmurraya massiliosenegalensis]